MSKYAIAWAEFYENNIAVEFYEADSAFEAAKECWKAHMLVGVTDYCILNNLMKQCDTFSCVNNIQQYFFDCDENISEPVLVDNLTKNNKCSMEFC